MKPAPVRIRLWSTGRLTARCFRRPTSCSATEDTGTIMRARPAAPRSSSARQRRPCERRTCAGRRSGVRAQQVHQQTMASAVGENPRGPAIRRTGQGPCRLGRYPRCRAGGGRRNHGFHGDQSRLDLTLVSFSTHSPVAQLVERSAVNRNVVGSSPTRGASNRPRGAAFPLKRRFQSQVSACFVRFMRML